MIMIIIMIIISAVIKVGVTWCGNWRCHPFLLKKWLPIFVIFLHAVTTRALFGLPADRLSSVLVNSAAKKLHFLSGVTLSVVCIFVCVL